MLQEWNVTIETLFEIASQNTPTLLQPEFKPMNAVIQELLGDNPLELPCDDTRLYVLSNPYRHFGASTILYDRVLEDISNLLNEDFYVLPSSIHEVIILPKSFSPDLADINKMIIDINNTAVSHEEVLSDHAYYYSRKERKLLDKDY